MSSSAVRPETTGADEAAWHAVQAAHAALDGTSLRDLFAADPVRFDRLSFETAEILLDLSKQRIDQGALSALLDLARSANLDDARTALFTGAPVNTTEGRAARHMALRASRDAAAFADVAGDVHATLDRMLAFADDVRSGRATASDGAPFTDVINIGIGGSDLGPLLVTQALAPYHDGPRVHYVSNVDGAHIADTLADLDPARTLVLVASKSFTTLETMMNAQTARHWLVDSVGEAAIEHHVAALSTNADAVAAFGISPQRTFGFWDWVGGRYSLWSAIGLPIAIAVGSDTFRALLAGAHDMDTHFATADLGANLPVLSALAGIWNRNIEGHATLAIVPYDQRLARLPAYIQQLDMESNGKRVRHDGTSVTHDTAPIVWGEPGTNAQHAFFQMLHQGTTVVPCEFLVAANPHEAGDAARAHHDALVANCFAQAEAFALGETEDEARTRMIASGVTAADTNRLAAHKTFPGNRPSSTLLYPKLTPHVLGALLAFFEHRVFTQSVVWGINAFDQWGVQLGKLLADELTPLMQGAPIDADRNASTAGLIKASRARRS
ncbi:MAG: glucose-6-phosphate isomerase [Pseudomonadota bacterium]